jgi:hypothetical protein
MSNPTDALHPAPYASDIDLSALDNHALSATQLLTAMNAAQLGAWCWELNSGDLHWSNGAHVFFGFDSALALPGNLQQLASLPFDDWPKAQQAFDAIINGK